MKETPYELLEDDKKKKIGKNNVKLWFKQFGPKHLKDIRATDIAEKLVLAKRDLEIQEEVISKLELHGPWRESELHETEGFYEVGDNVIRTRTSLKPPTDKQRSKFMLMVFIRPPGDGKNVETDVAGEKQMVVEAKDVVEDAVIEPQEEKFEQNTCLLSGIQTAKSWGR
ncbi:hypothetical protein Tco_1491835 [Tanacetum coccineum]